MEETKQNNILLAEFMGFKKLTNGTMRTSKQYGGNTIGESDTALFRISWDWLMPVLQKCDAVAYELRVHDDWIERFQTSLSQYDILDVYDVCVEFVKWFNENKSK